MELIILVAIIGFVVFFFKRFSNVVYAVAIIDIMLRILTFIKLNIGLKDVANIIDKYIPANIPAIIDKYSSGVVTTVLLWIYVVIFIIFEGYVIKAFFNKKR